MKQEQMLMIALAFLAGYFLNRLMGREGWSDADWTTGWPQNQINIEDGSVIEATRDLGMSVTNWNNCKREVEGNNEYGPQRTQIDDSFCNSKAEECMSDKISESLAAGNNLDIANMMGLAECLGSYGRRDEYIGAKGIIPVPRMDKEPSVPPPVAPPPPDPPPCDSIDQFFGSISDLTNVCLGFENTRSNYSCTHSDACHTAAFNARNCATNFRSIPGSAELDQWTKPCSSPP
jgi:hypothetical protein